MIRVNLIAVAVLTLIAFIASSIYYSSALFGQRFLELSGAGASSQPSPTKALLEIFRTFVLAYVIARLVAGTNSVSWKGSLRLGLMLWVGFPVILLSGSVLWQNVPWQLAAIHAGDWLMKLLLIPIGIELWPKRRRLRIA